MGTKPSVNPRLVIIDGKDKGKVILLHDGTFVIGRSKGDVVIPDPRISRSHCEIKFDANTGVVTFTDLKSLNGTLVNGEAKETGELKDGDRILLGNTLFDCQIGSEPTDRSALDDGPPAAPGFKDAPPPPADPVSEVSIVARQKGGEKTSSKKKKKKKRANFPPEPMLGEFEAPLRKEPQAFEEPSEVSEIHESDVRHDAPSVEEWKVKPQKRKSSTGIFASYRNLPPRSRKIYASCALALLVTFWFFGGGSETGGRDLASVKKLESQGRLDEARLTAEDLTKKQPMNAEVHSVLGNLYLQQGKYDLAVKAFKKSLDLQPKQGAVLAKLARTYLLSDRYDEAGQTDREMDQLIIDGPHDRDFFVEAAKLYLDFDSLKVAPEKMVVMGQALQNKFAPDDASGFKLEAKGHILKHNSQLAIQILEKAKPSHPDDQQFYLYEVLARVELADFQGADKVIKDWVHGFPMSTQPLLFLAEESYAKKEYVGSFKYLQRIIEIGADRKDDPTIRIAYNRIAKLYSMNGQTAQAVDAMKKSCQLGFRASCEDPMVKNAAPSEPPPMK